MRRHLCHGLRSAAQCIQACHTTAKAQRRCLVGAGTARLTFGELSQSERTRENTTRTGLATTDVVIAQHAMVAALLLIAAMRHA